MARKTSNTFALLFAAGSVALSGCAASSGTMGEMAAAAMGIPVMPAFLEDQQMVPRTASMAIDGIWMVDNIQKRVRFDGGRSYAVDGWLHALSLRVQPNMVVVKDITQSSAGTYSGQDLPLMGPVTYSFLPNGKMQGAVKGIAGPVTIILTPMAIDQPDRLRSELQAAGLNAAAWNIPGPQPGYVTPPSQPVPIESPPTDPDPVPVTDPETGTEPDTEDCVVIGIGADGAPICA